MQPIPAKSILADPRPAASPDSPGGRPHRVVAKTRLPGICYWFNLRRRMKITADDSPLPQVFSQPKRRNISK